jgi:hypothetical protein
MQANAARRPVRSRWRALARLAMASATAFEIKRRIDAMDLVYIRDRSVCIITSFAFIRALRRPRQWRLGVTKPLWEIGDIVDVLEAWRLRQYKDCC